VVEGVDKSADGLMGVLLPATRSGLGFFSSS